MLFRSPHGPRAGSCLCHQRADHARQRGQLRFALAGVLAEEFHDAGAVAATDSRFAANRAVADGGGLFALATSTVVSSQFVSNTAVGNGGGMRGVLTATLAGTTFLSNTAAAAGGAVFDSGSTLVNSSFTGNATGAAGNAGGGYFNGIAVLTNVTVTPPAGAGVASCTGIDVVRPYGTLSVVGRLMI